MLPTANLIFTVYQAWCASDLAGKGIIAIQLLASAWVAAYGITHSATLKRVAMQTEDFRRFFAKNKSVVDFYFTHAAGRNPILSIYTKATERLLIELGSRSGSAPLNSREVVGKTLDQASFDIVKGVAEENLAIESLRLENGMSYLAAIATIAPFLGLLGTVLGVMEAFLDMGQQGSVNLATVAPYLSTAMLTTVVGLVVAIPSVVSYNVFSRKIGELQIQFDGFTDEYLGRVGSEFRVGATAAGGSGAARQE